MTNTTLQKQHRILWHSIPELALSVVIIGAALWGGSIPAVAGVGFSALTLVILLGMVLDNTIYPHIWRSRDDGVLLAKQYLLCLGIILYSSRLTFSQTADVGISGIIIDVLTLPSTFLLAYFLGQKVLDLDKHTSQLISVGSSICGVVVVLATEPVMKVEASKITVAVATVAILGTVVIFLYPTIYPLMSQWLSPETSGIYIGSTVYEVVQVVAAGHTISPDVEDAAVISKMPRVVMLAPLPILLAVRAKQLSGANSGEKGRITIPWFAILFVVAAIFNSFHLLPQSVVNILVTLDTFLPAMAMAALGLITHVSVLKKVGVKPLLMVLALFAWLIVGGGATNYVTQSAIA